MICLFGNPRVKGQVRDVGGRGPWYPLSLQGCGMCKSYTVADGRHLEVCNCHTSAVYYDVDLQQGVVDRATGQRAAKEEKIA